MRFQVEEKLTGAAGAWVAEALGIPAIPEAQVNALIRRWPVEERPPVIRGRRRWSREHLSRLLDEVRARRASA